MQPLLRAQHRVERTSEGENVWRSQALSPSERSILGALRTPQLVADLLRSMDLSPGEIESALVRMMRAGWVLVSDPAQVVDEAMAALDEQPSEVDANELEELLSRHRAEKAQDAARAAAQEQGLAPDQVVSSHPSQAPLASTTSLPDQEIAPLPAVQAKEHDPAEALPFDHQEAESDGLLEALRHPEQAASISGHVEEWAPPSGGLAALLRALGEPVPEGVEISPDQEEHLRDVMPLEPWGGSFSPPVAEPPSPPEKPGFVRLRDQPSDDTRPKAAPRLGVFRESLNKVQQEQAQDQAVRDRARQIRQQREAEQKKVNEQREAKRQVEQQSREGTTLLGLSQKLARIKNDREQGDN